MIMSVTMEKLRRQIIKVCPKYVDEYTCRTEENSVKDFDVALMERFPHFEQHYVNGDNCLDSVLFFALIKNEVGEANLAALSFAGKIKNIKGETLSEWRTKNIGEQLLLLDKPPLFLIEYVSVATEGIGIPSPLNDLGTVEKSLTFYEIGEWFIEDHSQLHESRKSHA